VKLPLPYWLRKKKVKPTAITGVGQRFEYEGNILMVSTIVWRGPHDIEITLTSEERYRA
jgi:hypothetical protein